MFNVATFNVNSVHARLPLVLDWLEKQEISVAGLQEIKCEDHKFPT